MSDESERLAFVIGEVHALLLFAQSLAIAASDKPLLLAGLETGSQKGLAQIEGEPVSDATIEGFQYAVEKLQNALRGIRGN